MESSSKVIEKNFEEIRNPDETLVTENTSPIGLSLHKDEILPKFHYDQEADKNLNSDELYFMDGISDMGVAHCSRDLSKPTAPVQSNNTKADTNLEEQFIVTHCLTDLNRSTAAIGDIEKADLNLKEQTTVAHCSRNLDKPIAAVKGNIAKAGRDEQINVLKSTCGSDEVEIIEDINMKLPVTVIAGFSTKHQPDSRPYKCDVCDKSYSLLRSLNSHKRCHRKEKPFQCNYCEQQFSTIGNLDKHIVIHSAAKPYKCGVCDKSFAEMKNLSCHIKVHRDGPPHIPLYTL